MLKPSLQTALILRTILAFEVFAVVAALSGTKFPVLMSETYNWQFNLQDSSVAAALAMVILAASIVSTGTGVVPEPGTLFLAGLGLAGMALVSRRKA
jgi:ABC-type sugar transport system permease subunit